MHNVFKINENVHFQDGSQPRRLPY